MKRSKQKGIAPLAVMVILACCGVLAIAGCQDENAPGRRMKPAAETLALDQCQRAEIFTACVQARVPMADISGNFESSRIDACATGAAQISIRYIPAIKPECLAPIPRQLTY